MARTVESPTEPDGAFVDVLVSVSRAMVALAARNLSQLDAEVTVPQYRTLVFLASSGPQRSVDVARELDVAPSTVTRMCDRLVRRGLVQRFHREDDLRPIWLCLTEAGKDLVGTIMVARRRALEELVGSAGVTVSKRTVAAMRAVAAAAGEVPDAQWWQRWEESATRGPGTWPAPSAPGRRRAA
ncbi:MarR family winged helix-turn-helix transcriptional regulator [Dactylosporangium sp. NPDC000521]|uniref:MarR family winged helix-turn-helix transcriptional regulator n=1 Tax=Dactylosporangium sp. NPDC000521 TaxID=3363975 RepID=UPI0036B3447C